MLLYSNADGNKILWPLVVGKSENPRYMKGVKHYTCIYKVYKMDG
jgi:hypothetical protein